MWKNRPVLQLLCRLVLGATFVWASLDKIAHPDRFAAIIHAYGILPGFAVNLFALVLPWLELFSGLLLVVGCWRRPAALWLSILLLVFILAIGFNLWRGLSLNCGCFSTAASAPESGWWLLLRDLLLLIPAVVILRFDKKS
jgi:uncharacterized membrane protein YphA (DoxX/SURF4 family)